MGDVFEGFDPRLNLQGFTSLPNAFFDTVMAKIDSLAEMKIILAVFRKTYGWLSHIDQSTGQAVYKQQDAISYSQLEEITGMSSPSISSGLTRAISDGFIIKMIQGDYSGKTSVYRVKMKGEDTPPPKDSGPDPTPESPQTPPDLKREKKILSKEDWEDFGVNTETDNANGLATKEVEKNDSKADILGDLFGPKTEDVPPKKKEKTRGGWKTKTNREMWNCNDLLGYYKDMFEVTFGVSFGHISGKERSTCNLLIEGYGSKTVAQVADYLFKNYRTLAYLPKDAAHFSIFYGWFKTLHSDALGLKQTDMKIREFDEDKHKGKDGVHGW